MKHFIKYKKNCGQTINSCPLGKTFQETVDKMNKTLSLIEEKLQQVSPTNEIQEMLQDVLSKWSGFFQTFAGKLIKHQIAVSTGKKIEWDEDIIHFTLSLAYLGGKKCYEQFIGKGLEKHSRTRDPASYCFVLPSLSTLWGYVPTFDVYQGIKPELCQQLKDMFVRAGETPAGILCFDEIHIQSGLVYVVSNATLVGACSGPISENAVDKVSVEKLKDDIATKVLKVFFVSKSGKIAPPLAFFPMSSSSGKSLFEKIDECIKSLKDYGIDVKILSGERGCLYMILFQYVENCIENHQPMKDI